MRLQYRHHKKIHHRQRPTWLWRLLLGRPPWLSYFPLCCYAQQDNQGMMSRTFARIAILLVLSAWKVGAAAHLRSAALFAATDAHAEPQPTLARELSSKSTSYYHTLSTATLGRPNPDAAIGNPLKGLVESPVYTNPPYKADIPLAVEFYYLDFDKIMKGNPSVVGEAKAFNWTYMDETLIGSASRNMHAVWRVIIHFPGQPLKVPQYLLDAGIDLRWYDATERSPVYSDAKLLEAIEQFIKFSAKRYDGDKRLGYIQAGLLGFWGEWHTHGHDFLTDAVRDKVLGVYASSYTKTHLQVRFSSQLAYQHQFGRHDDSFGFETLDGPANGGVNESWFFWPDLVSKGQGDFWKKASMGGEVRGSIADEIFQPWYNARSHRKQSFMECVNVTHTTWMFHHSSFRNGGYAAGSAALANARFAHARMGYNFHVRAIAVKSSRTHVATVDIDVNITQIGVAPFYYDLSLGLQCPGMTKKVVGGVDQLIDQGSVMKIGFTGVPATEACLSALSLSLDSSYAYSGRPIKFAQKNGSLVFKLPLPGTQGPVNDAGEASVPPKPVTKCNLACQLKRLVKRQQ